MRRQATQTSRLLYSMCSLLASAFTKSAFRVNTCSCGLVVQDKANGVCGSMPRVLGR